MTTIELDTTITERGIVCSHPVLGQIATLQREPVCKHTADGSPRWYVFPYSFAPWIWGKRFKSLHAAEQYAVALAYEQQETEREERVY